MKLKFDGANNLDPFEWPNVRRILRTHLTSNGDRVIRVMRYSFAFGPRLDVQSPYNDETISAMPTFDVQGDTDETDA